MASTVNLRSIAVPFAVLCGLLASAGGPTLAADPSPLPIRVRLEWGSGPARRWSGLLQVSEGRIEKPRPLGIEADDPGSFRISGNTLKVRHRTARVYDGIDFTINASPAATLSVMLSSGGSQPIRKRFRVRLSQLIGGARFEEPIGADGARAVMRRVPGDQLKVAIDRPHLVFSPGETLTAFLRWTPWNQTDRDAQPVLRWQLSPARSNEILAGGSRTVQAIASGERRSSIPLRISLPRSEGVYDVRLHLIAAHRLVRQSVVQVVVVSATSAHPDGLSLAGSRQRRVDSFRPAEAGFFRRVGKRRRFGRFGRSWNRLRELLPQRALKNDRSLAGSTSAPIHWSAYKLHIPDPERPHRIVITAPAGTSQHVGVSLLEPDAAGQLMPIGLDSGFTVSAGIDLRTDPNSAVDRQTASQTAEAATVRHEMLCWPRTSQPILLLHDLGSGRPVDVSEVSVYEIESFGAAASVQHRSQAGSRRLVGPLMQKPLLPENFGATNVYDKQGRRSLDDWQTFYTAGRRLTEYLDLTGNNSLLLAVLADGSTIYPSRLLEPTPRYDTGTFSSVGGDPVRKDVLELLYRLFDREQLVLIPELQFSTPLPVLERLLATGKSDVRGIELIGRDGRSWRESRGAARGLAPYYNPLDPRVQKAILDVLRELVDRYDAHDSYQGVAIELSSVGYLQFPGLNWGYDDNTVARFAQATGTDIPSATGEKRFAVRHRFLTGPARRLWVRWRCAELAKFHRRLAKVVTDSKPTARFVLSGNRLLRGSNPDDSLSRTITTGGHLDALLPPKGLDFKLYAKTPRLIVLHPALWSSSRGPLAAVLDDSINRSPNLTALFGDVSQGSLFYHMPQECRLPDFDAVSPWQPAFTWLAAQTSPAGGPANRRRYAHALAAYDSRMIFDGGWMIPLGQESATRPIRSVIGALPAVPFHPVAKQKQPVVVRIARDHRRTWLYAVNDFPGNVTVTLRLSSPAETSARLLGQQTPLERTADAKTGGSVLRWQLAAYDLRACELDSPRVHVIGLEVDPSRTSLAAIRRNINRFDRKISQVGRASKLKSTFLSNPGFEQSPTGPNRLPGWEIPIHTAGLWTLDRHQPRSGQSALLLTAGSGNRAVLRSPLPLRDNRLVMMSLWLRSDRPRTNVRLVFEANIDGQRHTQATPVRVGTHWRRYQFRVQDIPAGRIEHPAVRVETTGTGRVWIDDVDIRLYRLTPSDLRQLTKTYAAVTLAWDDKRYADCQRLLEGYWGRFLFDTDSASQSSPPPAAPKPTRAAGPFRRLFR